MFRECKKGGGSGYNVFGTPAKPPRCAGAQRGEQVGQQPALWQKGEERTALPRTWRARNTKDFCRFLATVSEDEKVMR